MSVDPLHTRLRSFALVGVRAFLVTWLVMSVGGIALAVMAGKWMPAVDPVYRTLLQVFFAGQFIVVGFYLALRRSVAAALTTGVKSLRLGQLGLSAFFDRFDPQGGPRGDDLDVIDEPHEEDAPSARAEAAGAEEDVPRAPAEAARSASPSTSASPNTSGEISMALAQERIGQVVSALAFGRRSRRGIFGWLRSTLVKTVGAIVLARFHRKAAGTSRINTASIRHELEAQIDDLLLARLRYTLFAWTVLVVAFLVAEVVAVSLIANRLAS